MAKRKLHSISNLDSLPLTFLDCSQLLPENLSQTEMFVETTSVKAVERDLDDFMEEIKKVKPARVADLEYQYGRWIATIGYFYNFPIQLMFHFVILNDHQITLYHPISELVFYPMVEKWLSLYFPTIPKTCHLTDMGEFCPYRKARSRASSTSQAKKLD